MKILVVGCGSIGRRHVSNAASLAETGVFDLDGDAARACAKENGAETFPSLEAALDWKPGGVVVATPHSSHLRVAKAAVEAGADVLIEKPISDDLAGVAEFLDFAEARNRRVFVVCNMRFHPAVELMKAGLPGIGRRLFARAQYGNYLPDMRKEADYRTLYCSRRETGGGVILDSIHEIDYLSWFFGDVESVCATAATIGGLDIDVEDYAAVNLTHESGVRTEIHLDYLQRHKRRGCEIVGTEGTLVWISEGKNPERCRVRIFPASTGKWETLLSSDGIDETMPYEKLMQSFLDAMEGRSNVLLDGRAAARELGVALAARASAETGKSVRPIFPS